MVMVFTAETEILPELLLYMAAIATLDPLASPEPTNGW